MSKIRVVGWLLTGAALLFLTRWLWQVDHAVWSKLWQADLKRLLASLVIFQLWFLLRYAGWDTVSRRLGLRDEHRSNLKMWTISELMRYVPGNVWSFAARYRGARQRGVTPSGAVIALILEALFLAAGAALVAALFWRLNWWWLWLVTAAVLAWIIPVLVGLIGRWRRWANIPGLSFAAAGKIFGLYALAWALYGWAQALLITAIPISGLPSLTTLMGINVAAWLIGYVSVITPMGLGVREVAFVGLLTSTTAAVGGLLAALTRVWMIVTELVFLTLVLSISGRKSVPKNKTEFAR